jgi:DNA-binding XRE family transcriptional regulator
MKIKWDPAPPGIGWNRIKALRKMGGLNQAQVAVGAGISIATLYNIEHGYEETTTDETKKKLADFFKCDVEDIFPAQMVGNIPKEQYNRQYKRGKTAASRSHRLEMLKDYLPEIEFVDPRAADKVLIKMTLDELDEIFHSGISVKEALSTLVALAKKYNLPAPQTK